MLGVVYDSCKEIFVIYWSVIHLQGSGIPLQGSCCFCWCMYLHTYIWCTLCPDI